MTAANTASCFQRLRSTSQPLAATSSGSPAERVK